MYILYTDQYEVSEVDDDDRSRDKHLTTWKDVLVKDHGQRERDGASKTAVRHHKHADSIQLRNSNQIREIIQHDHH